MRHSPIGCAAALVVSMALAGVADAEPPDTTRKHPDPAYLGELTPELDPLERVIDEIRSHPDVTNELLRNVYKDIRVPALLAGLQIQPKVFEVNTDAGEPAALGLSYTFARALALQQMTSGDHPLDLGFDLSADGNVALSRNRNPADFLKTSLSLKARQFVSGTINGTEASADFLQEAARLSARFQDPDELDRSPEWNAFKERLWTDVLSKAGTEVLWQFGGTASLEANQAFTSKQWAYGALATLCVRDWHSKGVLQVFDYPFALLRVLSGMDSRFLPRGDAVPALLLGIDLVDPKDNQARQALPGGTDSYARFRSELETRARVAKIGASEVWMDADWRVYQEMGADAAIKAADQDVFSYFVATLEVSSGVLVSYATGRLPFDQANTSRWELGWHFNLGD